MLVPAELCSVAVVPRNESAESLFPDKEAIAVGNLITQMLAMGDIQSLEEGRTIIGNSFAEEFRIFEPQDVDVWRQALSKWRSICR